MADHINSSPRPSGANGPAASAGGSLRTGQAGEGPASTLPAGRGQPSGSQGDAATVSGTNALAPSERATELTFDAFRKANVARCLKWHPAGIESWSPSDWLTAVTCELGELASLLKMRNRERDGLPGNKFSPSHKQIADELADVLTYLDLLAEALGVNLGAAAVEKFNEVSARVGFHDRIELAPRSAIRLTVLPPDDHTNDPEPLG